MGAQPFVRSKNLLAPALELKRAFDDPCAVVDLIEQGSPYKTEARVHRRPGEELTGGWFRNFWALGGKVVFDGAASLFDNPNFIAAARQVFKAEVVRPVAMMTNLNLPSAALPPHLDLPFFRGLTNREVPSWMLVPMGYSGLFHDQAIPVASAITWFHEEDGGAFEYWPQGLQASSVSVQPPYPNKSVIADNEYMYHRVGATGTPDEYWSATSVPHDATLELTPARDWLVRHEDSELARLPYEKVRLSVLWKAFCFQSAAMAASYDDHSHDLTPALVTARFCDDLHRRGIPFAEPGEPETDLAWKQTLMTNYGPPDA
jgi:hypothetical protein